MASRVGIEPTTKGLKVPCSTAELPAREKGPFTFRSGIPGPRVTPADARRTPVGTPLGIRSRSREQVIDFEAAAKLRPGASAGRSARVAAVDYGRRAADVFERHPVREERQDEAVPEIVQPEPLDPCRGQELLEVVRDVGRVERPPSMRGEDERAVRRPSAIRSDGGAPVGPMPAPTSAS